MTEINVVGEEYRTHSNLCPPLSQQEELHRFCRRQNYRPGLPAISTSPFQDADTARLASRPEPAQHPDSPRGLGRGENEGVHPRH